MQSTAVKANKRNEAKRPIPSRDKTPDPGKPLDVQEAWDKKIDFLLALESTIGEQRVDVVIDSGKGKPIEHVARETGVIL